MRIGCGLGALLQAGCACVQAPLDEEDLARIDELLAARLQHKIGRRFEQARPPPRPAPRPAPRCASSLPASACARARLPTYRTAADLLRCPRPLPCSPPCSPAARHAQADRCLAELRDDYGVFVNDKLKGWRADGGIFPTHARVEGDGDGSPDMEATKGDYAVPKLRQMRV